MKTLFVAVLLLLAFGTPTWAQDCVCYTPVTYTYTTPVTYTYTTPVYYYYPTYTYTYPTYWYYPTYTYTYDTYPTYTYTYRRELFGKLFASL